VVISDQVGLRITGAATEVDEIERLVGIA